MVLVEDIMTKNPVTLGKDDLVTKARSLMRKRGFRAIPVVDDENLVGIISRSDVLHITSSKTNLKVSGLMSRNVTVLSPSEDLFSAARKIIGAGVRQLPVYDKKLVGIVSSLDILNAFVRNKYAPSKKAISAVMNERVVFYSPGDDLSKVWKSMIDSNFSGWPVVEGDRVLGMVTMMDILKHGKARISMESGRPKSIHIRKIMKTPVVTADVGSDIATVAKIMAKKRILRVPIVRGQKIVGIVDIEDILRAYVD